MIQQNTVPNTVVQHRLHELPANHTVVQINDKIMTEIPTLYLKWQGKPHNCIIFSDCYVVEIH